MGSDARVVDAARVSFEKEASNYTEAQNEKLIRYLAVHQHFSPFTHNSITLRETVPIFVARQRFKHTVGFTYNEVSRRYVDSPPEFYIPDAWRKRADNKKQGSSDEVVNKLRFIFGDGSFSILGPDEIYHNYLDDALHVYHTLIQGGVAPEQARMVLPQSMMTSYYCTGSLAAFARAYKLRSEESAQKEIQELATQWDQLIRPLFPISWSCLVDE
jgi:thymidylate synthase (FAD)